MGPDVDWPVNALSVSVCATTVAVTILCEFFIAKPLCTQRLRTHEQRGPLTTLALLHCGMGLLPVAYATANFFMLLYPSCVEVMEPVLFATEAVALNGFWWILLTLAGGFDKAAACFDAMPSGAACMLGPHCCNRICFHFRDGRQALRVFQCMCMQLIIIGPVCKSLQFNDVVQVRMLALLIRIISLVFFLHALLSTHTVARRNMSKAAKPESQLIVIKLLVLIALIQSAVKTLGWPPPDGAPDGVVRFFAWLTCIETALFSLAFAWAFGEAALWAAVDGAKGDEESSISSPLLGDKK